MNSSTEISQEPSIMKPVSSISSFVFNAGFLQGTFSDSTLIIKGETYHLHALFLGRSPVLLQKLIENNPKGDVHYTIEVETEDPYVTKESCLFVLSTLYCDSPRIPAEVNVCSVLAVSDLLGLDTLAFEAASLIEKSIRPETMESVIRFLDPNFEGLERLKMGMYPRFTSGLFNKAIQVMYNTLVSNWNTEYARLLCNLPFEVIKDLLESDKLTVGASSMARYKLANEIVKMRASFRKQNHIEGKGDESVVLAFDEGSRGIQLVHIAPGAESRRKIWKATSVR